MLSLKSLSKIREAIFSETLLLTEIVEHYLARIKDSEYLNIYVEVFDEEARQRAKTLDAKYKKDPGSVGKLFGAVFSIKDVLCYKGHEVSAGSKILSGFESQFSATAIQRLLDEDAIIIGRTNCDEFAMGSSNEHSAYGPTLNAKGKNRIPGGSSGGAAVSVQADTCLIALGSDTGGSVRQPAAFTGIYGFKPTYGRISRHGLIAYASSFDQIGILSHNVEDIAITLEVIAGKDQYDSTVSSRNVETYNTFEEDKKYKIAYIPEIMESSGLDEEIKKASSAFMKKLEDNGHSLGKVQMTLLDYLVPAYYVLTTAEASSNLSRYDGVRYGYRAKEVNSPEEMYRKSRTEGFGMEVKRRIMLGTFVLSAGYFDAYFAKAQKVRSLVKNEVGRIFEDYDFLIMPTSANVAWEIGSKNDDPVAVYLSDIYTVLANLTGIPAISLFLENNHEEMPFGIQVLAKKFEEKPLLNFVNSLSS